MPDISVVIPMHNSSQTIVATLASVAAQRGCHFEVIVVDDGSTDGCERKVMRLARGDRRIRLVSQPAMGVSAARNLGVVLAQSPLIAFLDADDLWAPYKLAVHVAAHRTDPSLAASYARIAFLPETATGLDEGRTRSSIAANPLSLADAVGENPVCSASNLVCRRDRILGSDGFAADWSHAEDQELVVRMVARGEKVVGLGHVLTGYRFSRGGLSMNFEAMYRGWSKLADRHLDPARRPAAEALFLRYLARRALRSGHSGMVPARFAVAGLKKDAAAFLADQRRGVATLAASLAAPLMPDAMRRVLFS